MKLPMRSLLACAITVTLSLSLLSAEGAHAASLQDIQKQVTQLQIEASTAAEGAQAAKVQLASLTRTLNGIRKEVNSQGKTVSQLRKSLGAIAVDQYRSGGLSQSLELLFSSDPALYLSAAGSLDSITRREGMQLRAYSTAQQRLTATTLTVNDKLAMVSKTRARLSSQAVQAQMKLAQAERLVSNLKKSDRIRLANMVRARNDKEQSNSLVFAKNVKGGSGRASVALNFALRQLGDWYVFGAAGMIFWDCSGLTMRAYQAAGVSLPHSAAAQASYGRGVPFNQIRPGDLVFFGNPISHNGIYLGGGRMVDAPHSGARVRIEPFGSYFGNLRLVSVRRF